jgi:hypothetical protein
MSFGLAADEHIARSLQSRLGEFMYGQPMIFDSSSEMSVNWPAFGSNAMILNITAVSEDLSEASAAVQRCRIVTGIMADVKNGI